MRIAIVENDYDSFVESPNDCYDFLPRLFSTSDYFSDRKHYGIDDDLEYKLNNALIYSDHNYNTFLHHAFRIIHDRFNSCYYRRLEVYDHSVIACHASSLNLNNRCPYFSHYDTTSVAGLIFMPKSECSPRNIKALFNQYADMLTCYASGLGMFYVRCYDIQPAFFNYYWSGDDPDRRLYDYLIKQEEEDAISLQYITSDHYLRESIRDNFGANKAFIDGELFDI